MVSATSVIYTPYNTCTDGGQHDGAQPPASIDVRPGGVNLSKKKKKISKYNTGGGYVQYSISHVNFFLFLVVCCAGIIILISLVLVVAVAAVLVSFAVKQYRSNQQSVTERYRENSSVVLAELDHFYTESLTVTEDTEHLNDFRHDIEVYQLEGHRCSELEYVTEYMLNGSDLTPIPPVYALANSSILVHICGSTNATTESDRLEIVLKNHLEETDENPYKVNFFHPGLVGKPRCKDMTFQLPANGYYTLIMMNPSTPIQFDYELTYKIRAIDTHLLAEHSFSNYTLHADQESCKFSLSSGIMKKSCFVAVIRENPNTTKGYVHIQLKYGNRMAGFIAGVVVLSVVAITLFIASIVIISLFIRRVIKHTKID